MCHISRDTATTIAVELIGIILYYCNSLLKNIVDRDIIKLQHYTEWSGLTVSSQ